MGDLDIWFIEVCRRIRLATDTGRIIARRGTSAKARIAADGLKGAVGDPWAPVHIENKSFTLGEGDFTYSKLVELLLSGDWKIPLLAKPARFEQGDTTLLLVTQALSRGNSKTWGHKSRSLPIGGKIIHRISMERERESIHQIAQQMMQEIKDFDAALRESLALFAVGGNLDKRPKNRYDCTREARRDYDRAVNDLFFPHLWERVLAQDLGAEAADIARLQFLRAIFEQAHVIFEAALVSVLCPSLYRHRATARAHSKFRGMLRSHFPELFASSSKGEQ